MNGGFRHRNYTRFGHFDIFASTRKVSERDLLFETFVKLTELLDYSLGFDAAKSISTLYKKDRGLAQSWLLRS